MIPIPLSMGITAFLRSFSNSFGILVSGYVISDVYNRSTIVGIVKWDLSSFIVHIHNQFYKQVSGIPQGSVLSYPLCNIYLREYEKRILSPVLGSTHGTSFIRFADDYVCISNDRNVILKIEDHVWHDSQSSF